MLTKEQVVLAEHEQQAYELMSELLQSIDLHNLVQAKGSATRDDNGDSSDTEASELMYTLHAVRNQLLTTLIRGVLHTCYEPLYGPLPPVRDVVPEDAHEVIRRYHPPVGLDDEALTLGDYLPEGCDDV